jgi:hypothetical protein
MACGVQRLMAKKKGITQNQNEGNRRVFGSFLAEVALGLPVAVPLTPDQESQRLKRALEAENERNVAAKGKHTRQALIPLTPPGYRKTGNLLFDLNKMYGRAALENPKTRTMLRQKYKGKIEVKRISGTWQILLPN